LLDDLPPSILTSKIFVTTGRKTTFYTPIGEYKVFLNKNFSYFNKISGDLDSALNKNAAAPKSKPVEVDDAKNLLMATQSCFRYTGLDYVFQVSLFDITKLRHLVVEVAG
jgi:hypothetical protein